MSAPLISIVAGTTYGLEVTWSTVGETGQREPVDLTGASSRFVIANGTRVLVDLRDEPAITLTPDAGRIAVRIGPEATAHQDAIDWQGARYELRVTLPGADVHSLMIGPARLIDGVIGALPEEVTQ